MEHGPDFEVDSVATTAVRGISHIATLPEVTVKIIELVEDPTLEGRPYDPPGAASEHPRT